MLAPVGPPPGARPAVAPPPRRTPDAARRRARLWPRGVPIEPQGRGDLGVRMRGRWPLPARPGAAGRRRYPGARRGAYRGGVPSPRPARCGVRAGRGWRLLAGRCAPPGGLAGAFRRGPLVGAAGPCRRAGRPAAAGCRSVSRRGWRMSTTAPQPGERVVDPQPTDCSDAPWLISDSTYQSHQNPPSSAGPKSMSCRRAGGRLPRYARIWPRPAAPAPAGSWPAPDHADAEITPPLRSRSAHRAAAPAADGERSATPRGEDATSGREPGGAAIAPASPARSATPRDRQHRAPDAACRRPRRGARANSTEIAHAPPPLGRCRAARDAAAAPPQVQDDRQARLRSGRRR